MKGKTHSEKGEIHAEKALCDAKVETVKSHVHQRMLSLLRRPSTEEDVVVYDARVTDGKRMVQVTVPTDDHFKMISGPVPETKDEAELRAAKVALIGLLGALREQLQGP